VGCLKARGSSSVEAPCGEVAGMQLCDSVAPRFICCLVTARGGSCYGNNNLICSRAENWERSDETSALLQSCCFPCLTLLLPHLPRPVRM